MPNISKPNDINNIWASTGDVVAPGSTYVANGWEAIIPPHEYFNWLDNRQDRFNAHVNQHGTPVWDSITEYQAGLSYTKGSDGIIYRAVTTNSNINPVGDLTGAWVNTNSSGMVVISTLGNSTWVVPTALSSGLKKAKITVTGGGASGGSGGSGNRGAGGGAGGTAIGSLDLTGVTSVAVTVGAGGARRTSGALDGNDGTQSKFGTSLFGNGGGNGGRYAVSAPVDGGFGGTASGGSLNLKGGDGSDGPTNSSGASSGGSGDGGSSYWGGCTRSSASSIATASAYGSGGGGGITGSSPGGDGVIVIEW
jgi:hypothetical protein